jgi:outer membrane receptor for ferrienterochelin and colicin
MNGDGFTDVPTGKQINIQPRISFFPKESHFEWQAGASYVTDERNGGKILSGQHASHDTIAYNISLNTNRKEVYSKSGYIFKKEETSTGIQLQYSEHELKNLYGRNQYNGKEKSLYVNWLFQSYLININHKYKTGISFIYDDLKENYRLYIFNRRELVPGAFIEYNYNKGHIFNLVAGIRADYSNFYGLFLTPRLHMRYELNHSNTVFRLSIGKAQKTANFLAENTGLMASSKNIVIHSSDFAMPYSLNPEVAWNYGINFSQKFRLNYRESFVTVDVYRTEFENQVVIDLDESPQEIHVYNLRNQSFSNTAQIEWNWEIRKRLNMRLAYRFVDTQTKYLKGYLQRPYVSMHRSFLNLSYETKNEKWLFDFTTQYHGKKRLPGTEGNPAQYRLANYSPEFFIVNAQISRVFKPRKFALEIYVGVENASNVQQKNAVIAAHDPEGKYFDATRVWGPIYGRMFYGGLKFKIK